MEVLNDLKEQSTIHSWLLEEEVPGVRYLRW
jgi:hypothetical protein